LTSPYYEQLAKWTEFIPKSEIRRLFLVKVKYYFAGGKPGSLPIGAFKKIIYQIADELETDCLDLLNYGPTSGIPSLKKTLGQRMRDKDGITLPKGTDDIVISTGSQQMLYGLLDVLLRPKDVIIMSRPSYLGFVVPVTKLGGDVLTVPTDINGIIPEYVEKAIEISQRELNRTPKAMYVVSDSDNPKGTTLPAKRRKKLFELTTQHEILLIEDSAYREIQFTEIPPPIKRFDTENEYVAYLRTSSKEAAVLRLGYSVLPEKLMLPMIKAKQYLDLCTSTLNQKILDIYYSKYIDEVLGDNLKTYKERCNMMQKTIDEHFPSQGQRTNPTGGFFFWFQMENEDFDSAKFLQEVAIPNDVLYVPGQAFYSIKGHSISSKDTKLHGNKIKKKGMRLSFSFTTPQEIAEGMERLGKLLQKEA
jgi:DNA-binding transcriptional MocR family regulator